MRAIADWGAALVLTLATHPDMERRKVPDLPAWIEAAGLPWLHLPIIDYQVPDDIFEHAWRSHGPRILRLLGGGEKVFVHCAGGLGRSGTVVARVLMEAGLSYDQAAAAARRTRPGSIETPGQERYLRELKFNNNK